MMFAFFLTALRVVRFTLRVMRAVATLGFAARSLAR